MISLDLEQAACVPSRLRGTAVTSGRGREQVAVPGPELLPDVGNLTARLLSLGTVMEQE